MEQSRKLSVNKQEVLRALCKKFRVNFAEFANIWAEKFIWQQRLFNYRDPYGFNQRVCRDVTNMILSEPVRIFTVNDNVNMLIEQDLKGRLRFDDVFSKHLFHCMGIGDMVMSVYVDQLDGLPAINYIPGNNIIPLSFNNHTVDELAWFTIEQKESEDPKSSEDLFIVACIEKLTGREFYCYQYESGNLLPINYGSPLWSRVMGNVYPAYDYVEETPIRKFAWISTGLNNARWIDTPYHNSFIWPIKWIDTLERDMQLFDQEYSNSVKKIFLSPELVKRTYDVTDSNGNPIPIKKINPRDSLFECVDMNEEKVKEWAPNIRFDQYAAKIKFDLKCWSTAVGLGKEMYDFDQGDIASTATQVILSHREAFNTIQNIKYNLTSAVQTIVYALLHHYVLSGILAPEDFESLGGAGGVHVEFDDGVFVNNQAKVLEGINLYNTIGPDGSRAIDKFTLLTKYCNKTEDEALKISTLSQQELLNGLMLQAQMGAGQEEGGEDNGKSEK